MVWGSSISSAYSRILLPINEKEGIQKIIGNNKLAAKGFQVEEIIWLK